jgi:hypothetical protein
LPSSISARAIQFRRHDPLILRSFAIWATGAVFSRASSAARREALRRLDKLLGGAE